MSHDKRVTDVRDRTDGPGHPNPHANVGSARRGFRRGASGEQVAGVGDVVAELGDEGVDAVELALAAQEVLETHVGDLAVEIDVDIEQVRLQQ